MPSLTDHQVALVGLRGAGKSTVGRLLARSLRREFFDLDDLALELARSRGLCAADMGFAELLSSRGWEEFRRLEAQALEAALAGSSKIVLATGGGAVESESNRALLRRRAVCVWLRAAPEVLAARVDQDPQSRPPLVGGGSLAEARELATRRAPWYREVARLGIDTGVLTPREVASRVAIGLRRLA